jgi:hypothetical protein
MDPLVLRFVERITAVLIGGLAIYLGYHLFFRVPEHKDSAGKVMLPWNISVVMSRIGPGVFFALFGVIDVGIALVRLLESGAVTSLHGADAYPSKKVRGTHSLVLELARSKVAWWINDFISNGSGPATMAKVSSKPPPPVVLPGLGAIVRVGPAQVLGPVSGVPDSRRGSLIRSSCFVSSEDRLQFYRTRLTMQTNTCRRAQAMGCITSIVGAAVFTLNATLPSQAIARSSTIELLLDSNASGLIAQGLCRTFIGEYVSNDHAIAVQNYIRNQGFDAWIEYHGSFVAGTRTYVVFAMLPCR